MISRDPTLDKPSYGEYMYNLYGYKLIKSRMKIYNLIPLLTKGFGYRRAHELISKDEIQTDKIKRFIFWITIAKSDYSLKEISVFFAEIFLHRESVLEAFEKEYSIAPEKPFED